ncbi:uncharacterized protein BO97DRAFT_144231 [Aspergillus homomorphus CBS 101889]|uniref:Uncharacterized protein n=1 Tax=Aspergillus homomorphus (strain CBS 101889) TaxID=1450537 RepID=A0A395HSA0_ASPHC|nr:hypothetical protein BO97DRAFT_144231 [Aspergillus homomorphus CBS 101889]RAL10215.1 hypothetical protein BO97DRAFT_144231 [Aspergillus homomorphus CBS 101889]
MGKPSAPDDFCSNSLEESELLSLLQTLARRVFELSFFPTILRIANPAWPATIPDLLHCCVSGCSDPRIAQEQLILASSVLMSLFSALLLVMRTKMELSNIERILIPLPLF